MQTRILALILIAATVLATPALARFVVLDLNFDGRTAGSALGRGGAFQGEPVTGPFDMADEFIVSEGAGDMALEFPDARILGPSEMYFALRDRMSLVDGKLTVRWTVTAQTPNSYEVSLRSDDLEHGEFFRLIFDNAGHMYWTDHDNPTGAFFAFYVAGVPIEFMLEVDIVDGTYTFYRNGTAVVTDEAHGVTGRGVGSLVFTHPDDGNATGSLVLDDIQLDWRPGDAHPLLDADFSDKPVGEVIDTRGAFHGEPVSLSGTTPEVEIGAPLGTKALVFQDESEFSAGTARFEFFNGVEPHDQPVSISFVIQVDQLDEYVIYIREQGSSAKRFLDISLRASGQAQFSDVVSGVVAYHIGSYQVGVPIKIELTFEPILDLYSVWWDGERIIHRRAHGITDDEVGRIVFGTSNDNDLDGTLYVDRIRAYTLGLAVGVDDGVAPTAPAILLGAAPNPFNPATEIRFELPSAAPVTLDIFDGRGRLVRQLVDETLSAGMHKPIWRGSDQHGHRVASGVYHARISAGGFTATTSMTLIK